METQAVRHNALHVAAPQAPDLKLCHSWCSICCMRAGEAAAKRLVLFRRLHPPSAPQGPRAAPPRGVGPHPRGAGTEGSGHYVPTQTGVSKGLGVQVLSRQHKPKPPQLEQGGQHTSPSIDQSEAQLLQEIAALEAELRQRARIGQPREVRSTMYV